MIPRLFDAGFQILCTENGTLGTSEENMSPSSDSVDFRGLLYNSGDGLALDVSSTSAADADEGTGAQTIRVYGLDTNFAWISEDITLSGQTKVTGSKTFLDVFYVEVLTAGSGIVNAGDIYVVATGTGGVYSSGEPGTLTSLMLFMPEGKTRSWNGHIVPPLGKDLRLVRLQTHFGGVEGYLRIYLDDFYASSRRRLLVAEHDIASDDGLFIDFTKSRLTVPEKTAIWFRAVASSASADAFMTVEFEQAV